MDLTEIPLDQLERHPLNSNVMPRELFAKLVEHIGRTDRYPPVIVRPMDPAASTFDNQSRFQILDGHHRIEALRQLKRPAARCVVWQVSDDEALLLLATLNRLQGRDDPHRRAALVAELARLRQAKAGDLAKLLPERGGELESLMSLRQEPPAPRPPQALADMPVAVHFFLKPAERDVLEQALRQAGGGREAALMRLVASRGST